MPQAGVREVRDKLSKYLRLVQRGERVVITDRGRPVAALVGLGQESSDEVAWSLVRQGLGDWDGGKPRGPDDPPRVSGRPAEEVVIEDRR